MVILRLNLLKGAGVKFGGHFHIVVADFNFLGVDRLAIRITSIDKCKVGALLLRDTAIDAHVEEAGGKVGPRIGMCGQRYGRNGDASRLHKVHRHISHRSQVAPCAIAREHGKFSRIEERNARVGIAVSDLRGTLLRRILNFLVSFLGGGWRYDGRNIHWRWRGGLRWRIWHGSRNPDQRRSCGLLRARAEREKERENCEARDHSNFLLARPGRKRGP